jgi:predicted small lipoprotein YifL
MVKLFMKNLCVLVLIMIIQSCGTKGSLYLPEEEYSLDDESSSERSTNRDLDESSGTVDEY